MLRISKTAAAASISADWLYQDWLLQQERCGRPQPNANLRAARAADKQQQRRSRRSLPSSTLWHAASGSGCGLREIFELRDPRLKLCDERRVDVCGSGDSR